MSMKLGYDLTIEQAQKLVMTPELIQAIQILQFNTQELDAYIQEQLLVNPVLEQSSDEVSDSSSHDAHEEHFDEEKKEQQSSKDDDFDWKEYLKDRQYDDISYRQSEYPSEDDKERNYERYVTSDVTLPEHLMFQLQFADLGKCGRRVGKYIIESLDENGYMTLTTEEIAKALGVPEENVKDTLEIIQSFDPVGVGASDLRECLTIQLRSKGLLTDAFENVVNEHLEDLANNRLSIIARDRKSVV